ncbi:unnamed protein product [Toxocara canis]|uniref:Uncharacterized protein n=1 Tax=Toxocara canis TaxID=6265 RepID=A0A183USI9_TOXCA|nr:unnamed protein product [Toxocara canis]
MASTEELNNTSSQVGDNLGTAAAVTEVNGEADESEFEKQEKQRQWERRKPKKAKRKTVFVPAPQIQTTSEKVTKVLNERGEELLQIARDVDIEMNDELFVQEEPKLFYIKEVGTQQEAALVSKQMASGVEPFSLYSNPHHDRHIPLMLNEVAAEMNAIADEEYQMKPRRYGVNICLYIYFWFKNFCFHKKLMDDYEEWHRDWLKYGDMADIVRSIKAKDKLESSEKFAFHKRRAVDKDETETANRSHNEGSSLSDEDDKRAAPNKDTDDISKVKLHVDDDDKDGDQ